MADVFDRFAWLHVVDPRLAEAYRAAHDTAFDAPRAAHVALRGFAEIFLSHEAIPPGVPRQVSLCDRIEAARKLRLLPNDVLDGLDALRVDGNAAAHPSHAERRPPRPVADALRTAWDCATWLHLRCGRREDEVPTFQAPTLADSAAVFRDAMLGGYLGGGDPVAKFHVAQALLEHQDRMRQKAQTDGDGMSLNRGPEAARLLRDATFYVPAARARLACLMLETSNPSEVDIAEAIDWLRSGCEDDDPESLFRLGAMHFHGQHGLPRELETARSLFQRAAVHEHPGALHALSVIDVEAGDVDSEARSRALARRAAEAGDPFGQTTYGSMLIEGVGGEVEAAEGAVWLRRSARAGWAPAVWCLASYLRAGSVAPLEGEDADSLLAQACELGSVDGLLHRAEVSLRGPDASVDFASALSDLADARTHAAVAEEHSAVNDRLTEALHRLRRRVNALPRTDERRRELCSLLIHFRADGSPRPRAEIGGLLLEVAREMSGNDPNASLEAWQLTLQANWGIPEPTAADVARVKAWTAESMTRLRAEARRVGRNAPCPCGSKQKAKHCHAR
ncbi:MAG: hypothetical protein JWM10_3033 [Myxococcaceae bacterium]|nr:hypothetical protein [Myxococcaceae bacterium]